MKPYKLKLKSKRLGSGKCQIKFFVSSEERQHYYGYLLTEAGTTLKEVVDKIEKRLRSEEAGDRFHQHLYNLAKKPVVEEQILVFNQRNS